jgi:divalent metal cation (Fe/Co/Zn/Cd) transporter
MPLGPSSRQSGPSITLAGTCCADCGCAQAAEPDERWLKQTRYARWLAWGSLAWMSAEGAVGLVAGISAGSIALIGWALGSVIEALASIVVVWRFTGSRTLSESAERRAQKAVAVSFWLLAPYVTAEAISDLTSHHAASTSLAGIILTAASVIVMPGLGIAKHRLGERLDSGATAGEGTQNLMCAAQAGAVLVGLAVIAIWPGGWPIDPIIALLIAAWSVWEGRESWQGSDCC